MCFRPTVFRFSRISTKDKKNSAILYTCQSGWAAGSSCQDVFRNIRKENNGLYNEFKEVLDN